MPRHFMILAAVAAAATAAACAAALAANPNLGKVQHIVVIYEENHSFDNLYGRWEGVNGLANADPAHTVQVNQNGQPYACLMQNDVNLTSPPLSVTCTDTTTGKSFSSHFANAPFLIDTYIPPTATTCPVPPSSPANGVANGSGLPGGCTRDIVHRFYQEQYQLDGGRQDRYVTSSDALGLTMGVYDTRALPIYAYLHAAGHPAYAIADNFLRAAFAGSYLNHQWLIAAATPVWPNAPTSGPDDLHSVLDQNGMPNNYPLYSSPLGTAVKDTALTPTCSGTSDRARVRQTGLVGFACGDYAVNTTQPFYQPYTPGTAVARRLPPQTAPTIGDRLSAAGIDWAWYSGGWSNANGDVGAPGWTNGTAAGPANASTTASCPDPNALAAAVWPNCPDKLFQFHHQPFNYYAAYATGTAARAQHLRDEQEFLSLVRGSTSTCNLKPVTFIKPIGAENEHPGYASETAGSSHLVQLLQMIQGSRCKDDTMVIVTYDEFGGQWDHVSPPGQGGTPGPHDKWGPGTRIPALVISPFLQGSFVVDHTQYDTTSIMATIERRFGLAPVGPRDAAVNDLSSAFDAPASTATP